MANNLKLNLEISTSGQQRTVSALQGILGEVKKLGESSNSVSELAQSLGISEKEARKFLATIGLTAEEARDAISAIRKMGNEGIDSARQFQLLSGKIKLTAEQFARLQAVASQSNNANSVSINQFAEGIGMAAFKINNIIQLFQSLQAAALPVYQSLIASNEALNSQLLSSQTNLASSTRIFKGDTEIADPTEKIKATETSLRLALAQIEKDTQELVGVTSADVNELFQITLTNAATINNQSKQFPDAIQAATSLTKGWASALKVVGVPLDQARQEINSILKGQVDQNSILAKNLNITNQQVRQWQSQGRLVDELNKRLETFVAGNAIAARSIEGIGSNIQDVIERTGRIAGEPLLEPIINTLDSIYQNLQSNQDAIIAYFQSWAQIGLEQSSLFSGAFVAAFDQFDEAIGELGRLSQQLFVILGNGATALLYTLSPITDLLGVIISKALEGYRKIADLILFRQIADQMQALETMQNRSNQLYDSGLTAITKYNQAKAAGLAVDENTARLAKNTAEAINLQIESLKQLNLISPELTETRNNEIKRLEALSQKLNAATGGITLQAKALEELGDSYKQLADRAENAQRNIKLEGQGDVDAFKKSIEELITTTKQQLELGQITSEVAKDRLREIQQNTKADVDSQIKAKEEIQRIEKQRFESSIALITASQSELESLRNQGIISEIAGERKLSELKLKEIEARIDRNRELQEIDQSSEERDKLIAEESKLDAQKEKILGDARKRERELEVKKYDDFRRAAESYYAQGIISLRAFNSEKLSIDLGQKDLELQQQIRSLDRISASDVDGRRAILGKINELTKQKQEILKKAREENEKLDKEEFENQRKILEAYYGEGLVSAKNFNDQKLTLDLNQIDLEISQQKDGLTRLASDDADGRLAINAKISEILAKRLAIIKRFQEDEKKRILEDFDEQLIGLESLNAQRLIKENDFTRAKTQNRLSQVDFEIRLNQGLLTRLGEADIDGRERIIADIAKLQIKRIKIIEDGVNAEFSLLADANKRSTDLIIQSDRERAIARKRLLLNQQADQESIKDQELIDDKTRLDAELNLAIEQEKQLESIRNISRSPEGLRRFEEQVRSARAKTTQITLNLLDNQEKQEERYRQRAIQGIERETASRNRSIDLQLSQINELNAARDRGIKALDANTSIEINATEAINRSLDRQNNLRSAQNDLRSAFIGARVSGEELSIQRINRAIEIRQRLESGETISFKERNLLLKEEAELVGSNSRSIRELLQERAEREAGLSAARRSAFNLEQSQAKNALELDIQKNELANRRAIIESKITEIKAKQAILDAQSLLNQQRLQNQKDLDQARSELAKAQLLPVGDGRYDAIASAQNRLIQAESNARIQEASALQNIDLAKQSLSIAEENRRQTEADIANQSKINELRRQTLAVQQDTAQKQFDMAESTKRYADELARAKAETEAINRLNRNGINVFTPDGVRFEARESGGNVTAGKPYLVGEKEPELFVPNVSGVILNQDQIRKNLANLNIDGTKLNDFLPIVDELKSLQGLIASRTSGQFVANFSRPDSDAFDNFLKLQRSALRI